MDELVYYWNYTCTSRTYSHLIHLEILTNLFSLASRFHLKKGQNQLDLRIFLKVIKILQHKVARDFNIVLMLIKSNSKTCQIGLVQGKWYRQWCFKIGHFMACQFRCGARLVSQLSSNAFFDYRLKRVAARRSRDYFVFVLMINVGRISTIYTPNRLD